MVRDALDNVAKLQQEWENFVSLGGMSPDALLDEAPHHLDLRPGFGGRTTIYHVAIFEAPYAHEYHMFHTPMFHSSAKIH